MLFIWIDDLIIEVAGSVVEIFFCLPCFKMIVFFDQGFKSSNNADWIRFNLPVSLHQDLVDVIDDGLGNILMHS